MGKELFPDFGRSQSMARAKQPWGTEHGVTVKLLVLLLVFGHCRATGGSSWTRQSPVSCIPFPGSILVTPSMAGSAAQTLALALLMGHFISYFSSVAVFSGFCCFTLCLSLISHKIENSLRIKQQITCSYGPRASLPGWLLTLVPVSPAWRNSCVAHQGSWPP